MKKGLLILVFILLYSKAHAQYPVLSKAYPDSLHELYFKGKLNKRAYLDSTVELFYRNITTGNYFKGDILLNYLQLYKKLAWASEDYKSYRPTYYVLLASNAHMRNRMGEAIFYHEKQDKELQKLGEYRPINALMEVCRTHGSNKNYEKAVEVYEKEQMYLSQFPNLLKKGKINSKQAINTVYLLNPVQYSYLMLKDTLKAQQIITLATAIQTELFKKISPQSEDGVIVRFLIVGMHLYTYDILKKFPQAYQKLIEVQQIIDGPSKLTKEWRSMLKTYYFAWACEHYLHTYQDDSAAYYIDKYARAPNSNFEHQLMVDTYKASLASNKGNYEVVYPAMEKVLATKDSLTSTIMQQMDELLYAHTQAENDRNDLTLAEQDKKDKNTIIIVISILSAFMVVLIYQWSQRRERITKRRIEQLNRMAEIQVAELEEVKLNERSLEQQRLGRELHDQLSSHVASLKYQLERISNQSENISKDEIYAIKDHVSDIYNAVREKSHKWAFEPVGAAEKSFEERIAALTSVTLPVNRCETEIQIDNHVLTGLSITDKIQILHIVQEAVTNILKHAHASKVSIILYEEEEEKILLIEDNGVGFKSDNLRLTNKGLGFESIKSRAHQLKGTFQVSSSENSGTKLKITIFKNHRIE